MMTKVRTGDSPSPADGQMNKDGTVRRLLTVCLSCLLTLILTASGYAQQSEKTPKKPAKKKQTRVAPAVKPELEPKAMEVPKAACDRLAAAKSMRFTSVVTYEYPSRLGPPLAYTTRSEVTMQRPDKLRVITPGDGPASEFYYDGKTMVAYAPAEKLAAVAEAPPTIDATLKKAFETAATYYPFADVVVADPYKDIAEGLWLAFYIGQSNIVGGTTTDSAAATSNAYSAGVAAGSANTAAAYNAGVATGSANTAAATTSAYNAGMAAGGANTAAATSSAYNAGVAAGAVAATTYAMGGVYGTLPAGSMSINKNGTTYYLSGNTWFQPSYGANGVFYRVVPAP